MPLESTAVGGMINLDLDDDWRLMGLEVLDARSVLSDAMLKALTD